jgi:1-aminocyclopropane-1-carboxylate deaminase
MQFTPMLIPLQLIEDAVTLHSGVRLFVLRIDLNHPFISGNKLFKLKYNLLEARKNNHTTLLTFGGAFSNHIAATAAAGKEHGFNTIGIIRGEEHTELNSTLKFAVSCGMQLHFVSRNLYRDKDKLYEYVNSKFANDNIYLIPEGGSNILGVNGCKEIIQYVTTDFDYICCACGTGATLAGILFSLQHGQSAIGFQVLKAEDYIKTQVEQFIEAENCFINRECDTPVWNINEEYHFGGYAKVTGELTRFMEEFERNNAIPLDYVYTGKMMFGIYDLIKKDFFKKEQTIIAVHTGGIQGNAGFME